MMRKIIKDIMSTDIKEASPEAMVSDVLKIMDSNAISCVPVVENGKPVGMFTERNLVRLVAVGKGKFEDCPVREVMSSPVLSVKEDIYLYEAYHVLEANGIRHLVVVDNNEEAVGVLTLSSIVNQIGSDLLIEFQPVHKLMSKMVFTVQEDISLREVLFEMSERSISCIIYARDDKPVGIITERDVIRHAFRHSDFDELTLKAIMKTPVVTVSGDTYVHDVVLLMRENHIRRVVVIREDGTIAGLATQSNIVKGLETRYIQVLKQVIKEKDMQLGVAVRERDEISIYLESILNNSLDMGIIATDDELRVIYFNKFAEKLLGCTPDTVLGNKVPDVHEAYGVEGKRLRAALDKVEQEGSHSFTYETKADEEPRFMRVRVAGIWDMEDNIAGYVHMISDITEQKRAEDNIRFMAYHDMLTGLPNRVAFDERFSLELARAERKGERLAVMVLDLDRFKAVNDSLGHYAGDVLLKVVAKRLQGALRRSDTLARIGGDEFALVLPEMNGEEDTMIVVEKLIGAISRPVDIKGEHLKVTMSIGISMYPEHGGKAKKLLHVADKAMYRAKSAGRITGGTNYAVGPNYNGTGSPADEMPCMA